MSLIRRSGEHHIDPHDAVQNTGREVELEVNEDAAWLAWNGIVAIFETGGDGAPTD